MSESDRIPLESKEVLDSLLDAVDVSVANEPNDLGNDADNSDNKAGEDLDSEVQDLDNKVEKSDASAEEYSEDQLDEIQGEDETDEDDEFGDMLFYPTYQNIPPPQDLDDIVLDLLTMPIFNDDDEDVDDSFDAILSEVGTGRLGIAIFRYDDEPNDELMAGEGEDDLEDNLEILMMFIMEGAEDDEQEVDGEQPQEGVGDGQGE